ncbi:MAG: SUMF1/EgtB/PvdO family nonheme iron enzyme, partial [Myxococcota bacterium]
HDQGVLHRDLKPDNLMVGRFGEVMVMDWGIAVRHGDPLEPEGSVVGTPRYMAPEQARGESAEQGPWSDVYALGVVLHERLVGAPPVRGDTAETLEQHRTHASRPFAVGVPPDLPQALVDIATHALADRPAQRLTDAGALGDALQAWWSGAEERARARATLAEAMVAVPRIADRWRDAAIHRQAARALLDGLSVFARAEEKEEAWALEDQASEAAREAAVLEADWLQRMGAVLEQAPDLEEAHAALADHYAARLVQAEVERRPEEVARFEVHLARHDRGAHAALLKGTGAVTLVTDPPGARVRAFRFVEQKRRLVPVLEHDLGETPLVEVAMARGSWLLEVTSPGHPVVRYPVAIERGDAWTGVRPGGADPHPIVLPLAAALGPDDVYVPAGWFWSGGDTRALEPLPRRRLWCDGLAVRRHSVTIGEFLALRETDPVLVGARPTGAGWREGTWVGDASQTRRPVTGLTLAESRALAGAESSRTGQPWRLPNELEFEKYARGVDGRAYPWGDHFEVSWANVPGNDPNRGPVPTPVDAHPLDCSVYGVVGCVGNVRERCGNPWLPDGPPVEEGGLVGGGDAPGDMVAARGGSAASDARGTRVASRFADPPDARLDRLGVRLVRVLSARS